MNLQASKDTYKANSKTTSDSISAGVTNKGGVYGDFASSKSSSRAEGEHYNYSGTLATEGKISMNVGNDMTADGYNALAKDVDINVGGDMSLSSKQNTDYAKDTSHGFGVGAGSNSKNTHLSNNHSNSDRQWTDNMASIVGTESVDIDVDGKLKMDGSMIANIDKDGKDAGNLDIKAGSIETSDISNYDRNSESGFSIDRRTGASNTGENDGKGDGYLDIGIVNKGSVTEGETKATIGKGNIEVADGSDISGINRDIDNANTITRDQITGALDGKLMLTGSWADTVWSSPNSALGLMLGVAGMPFGAEMHYDSEKGIVYFENNPMTWKNGGALTLGDIVNYYKSSHPDDAVLSYLANYETYKKYGQTGEWFKVDQDQWIILKDHEHQHTLQSREYGPLFLPLYFISGGVSHMNWMEKQADERGNKAYIDSGRTEHEIPYRYQQKGK